MELLSGPCRAVKACPAVTKICRYTLAVLATGHWVLVAGHCQWGVYGDEGHVEQDDGSRTGRIFPDA